MSSLLITLFLSIWNSFRSIAHKDAEGVLFLLFHCSTYVSCVEVCSDHG